MTIRLPAWVLAALVAATGTAHAQDGGIQSPFAFGAGNRALGMGGTYVAIADDASGALWNPAGLARVTRFEVQTSQTQYFDLGIRESFVGAVWPDWRWGALSGTFRHFGVSGIERRDERNVLISEDLSDSQTELAIGFGRPMSETWTLGAALKARRQSLAGLTANALGIDLGVTLQPVAFVGTRHAWLQNVTWGIAISNLVEPTMRLEQEAVGDPIALRSGIAYRHPLLTGKGLIAGIDLEQPQGGTARLRMGMEASVHPSLALRFGLHRGGLTAGTGFTYRDFGFDYVFENAAIDAVHRFGLTYAFGPTVGERRAAAERREEEAIQARLAEAFQKRLDEQISGLLARAEEHRARGRYDEALELTATVETLQPGHRDAGVLHLRLLRERAEQLERSGAFADAAIAWGHLLTAAPADSAAAQGQRRCQTESDQRALRSTELRTRFAQGLEAFGAGRLAAARDAFREVAAAEPSDAEAKSMLRRTTQAIERRVRDLMRQSERYVAGGMLAEAEVTLDQVAALDAETDGLAEAQVAVARARQSSVERRTVGAPKSVATAPARREPKRAQAKELEVLYRRGNDAMRARRSDDALRYWELVWSADRNYAGVAELLKREYLTRGMESYAAGRLDEAVGFWEKALLVDPKDERAMGYLARAHKQLARTREILGTK